MFAVYGMRPLYTRLSFLRLCPFLTQKFPSCSFKEFNDVYIVSWRSLKIIKVANKINQFCFLNTPANYSTKPSRPSRDDIQLNRKILSLKTVEEQLGLFESVKNSANIVNRVTMLFNISEIAERDREQRLVLEHEREVLQQGHNSTYMELLESISKEISECQPRELANVLFALGKIGEKDHRLVHVCEEEILSCDILAFKHAEICQIVNGCKNLNLTSSDIFSKFQDAVLDGRVNIKDFESCVLDTILLSFAKTGNGSVKLFNVFLDEILSRDFSKFNIFDLTAFVWSYAKKELESNRLFDLVEEEILRRGMSDFCIADIIQILWAFAKASKGSKQLFYQFDIELVLRGLEGFNNAELLEIVWSFSKRNVTKAKVFELIENEIFERGVHNFHTHQLVLILWSFVSAQRHNDLLVAEIEGELCLKDVKQLENSRLCQVVWCLGKARKLDSKFFDVIEMEVAQRGVLKFTVNEKLMLIRGFIEAKKGSTEFYELLVSSFSTKDFCNLNSGTMCECAWCFYKVGIDAGEQFDALEKEILTKDKYFFNEKELAFIKEIFQYVGKGRNLFGL